MTWICSDTRLPKTLHVHVAHGVCAASEARGRRVVGDKCLMTAATGGGKGWVFIKGGCSGREVQWIGVVLYNKLVHNII